jgi:hypothetical protein
VTKRLPAEKTASMTGSLFFSPELLSPSIIRKTPESTDRNAGGN